MPAPSTYKPPSSFDPSEPTVLPSPTPSSADEETFYTPPPRFSPPEEADLLSTSQTQKATANTLYSSGHYSDAISTYDRALSSCPSYLNYEVAVLKSNIAACYIKLEQWKEAVEAATKAVERLEEEVPTKPRSKKKRGEGDTKGGSGNGRDKGLGSGDKTAAGGMGRGKGVGKDKGKGDRIEGGEGEAEGEGEAGRVVEIEEEDEEEVQRELRRLQIGDERRRQVETLRGKSLMRRARGNEELGGWGNLVAAEEDYKVLATSEALPPADRKFVRQRLVTLPGRVAVAKEKEMGEMMGKLKDLGNGFLKPFGLSTDMFQFQKDERTGGYNMSFGSQ